ncbi:hypothetical protein VZO05_05200 [Aggregatilineales bacterium SYSU G02658]
MQVARYWRLKQHLYTLMIEDQDIEVGHSQETAAAEPEKSQEALATTPRLEKMQSVA